MEDKDLRKSYYDNDNIDVESTETEEDPRIKAINQLASSLTKKRNLAVQARAASGIEREWREDELAFEGQDEHTRSYDMIDYATEQAPSMTTTTEQRRSKVVLNIIRPKCETAEGRFADIQLPEDDRNWGLKPTPVPELANIKLEKDRPAALKDNSPLFKNEAGEYVSGITPDQAEQMGYAPAKMGEVAESVETKAEERMTLMEDEIDDQLNSCNFNGECREAIRYAVRLGTGILKGPVVVSDSRRKWKKVEEDGVRKRL